MADPCVFCKIIAGEIKSTKVYEDDSVFAFEDLHPVAPCHVLIVPKKHLASVNELTGNDGPLLAKIFLAAQQVAQRKGVNQSGYRVLVNTGADAGQTVFHLHYHLLGGERLHPM